MPAIDRSRTIDCRYPQTEDGTYVIGNSVRLSSYPQQPTTPFIASRGEHTELVLGQLAAGAKL